jgi:hypothetical protein
MKNIFKGRIAWIIIGSIVGLIILAIVSKKISRLVRAFKVAKENKTEQQALQLAGVKKTYPESWYQNKASTLYSSMKSTWYDPSTWGTSEEPIYQVFNECQNDLDVIALYTAFGVRDGYTLQEWLDGDLEPEEKDKINQMFSMKGITKRV